MFETLDKTLAEARSLGIQQDEFRQLGPSRWEAVFDSILLSLTNDGRTNRYRRWLWEDFVEPTHYLEPPITGKLSRLSAFGAPSDQIYVVIEDWNGTKKRGYHWLLQGTLEASLSVLNEMNFTEFYLVGRSINWVIAENHHGIWIAGGLHAVKIFKAIEAADILKNQKIGGIEFVDEVE